MTTNEEMLGRADVNDLEAILAITSKDVDELVHAVKDNADALFTWNYEKGERPALNKLYEKAKGAQWNGETDLPWDTEVDIEKVVANAPRDKDADPVFVAAQRPGQPLHNWGEKEWNQLIIESQNWTMSQFMHGEQGALVCTAKIVETVPWIDAKYYAATQVMDEARHVEVFAKYLDTKMNGHYPLNAHLGMLLDDIIQDSRWDMTYLGMQIMIEGLALGAFSMMYQATREPLLKELLRYVVEKGSITVDGVSLTVVAALDDGFTVAVIPHTMAVTTLGSRRPGDPVNLEVDVMAKYAEKLLGGIRHVDA